VLIEDHARALLPEWLRFVRGVVECDDIPLNVSREMVQKTAVVRKIHELLVKRVLARLGELASAPVEGEGAPKVPWSTVWNAFGPLIKEGYWHERDELREQITPLLRFHTTACATPDGLRSLAEIHAARKEGQEHLWYLTAPSQQAALASPHLEAFRKRGWEVMLLSDPVDEWLVQRLDAYEGTTLKSAARGALDLPKEEGAEDVDIGAFTTWARGVLGDVVADVRPSTRLTDSAAVLVDADKGVGANMERLLRHANQGVTASPRVFELNAGHALVRNLTQLHEKGRVEDASEMLLLLLDDARLLEGDTSVDPAAVGRRLQALLVRASEAALRG
jgi:molecular chaperone HtpG